MQNLKSYTTPHNMPSGESGRLASLLTLDEGAGVDEVALAREVGEGLPTRAAMALIDVLGRTRVVGPIIPEATLRRHVKSRTKLPREHSERLYAISRVVDAAARAWHGDHAATLAFLDRPHPLLAGQSPIDMACSSTAGADAVLALIRRAEAGIAL